MTRLFSGITGLLMVGQLVGCTDHRVPAVTPGAARLRVKSLMQQNSPASGITSAFAYDGQGRLSSITAFQTPDSTAGPVEVSSYQYDAQNRLTQVQHSVVRRGSNAETYTLTYNGAGQLSQLMNSPSTFSVSPQYNSANQVSTYSKSINVPGLSSSGSGSLTFTGNNVTSASETFSVTRSGGPSSPVYSRSISTTYTFDDKPNPFYGLFIIPAAGVFLPSAGVGSFGPFYTLYGGIDNLYNLSQNNVLTAVDANRVTTAYTYTYNAANLPTTRVTTTAGSVTDVLRYNYENY